MMEARRNEYDLLRIPWAIMLATISLGMLRWQHDFEQFVPESPQNFLLWVAALYLCLIGGPIATIAALFGRAKVGLVFVAIFALLLLAIFVPKLVAAS